MTRMANRKWEASKYEKLFDKYLTENGYTFDIVKEYQSKTYYNISKDGHTWENYEFMLIQYKNMKQYFRMFEDMFKFHMEYDNKKGK